MFVFVVEVDWLSFLLVMIDVGLSVDWVNGVVFSVWFEVVRVLFILVFGFVKVVVLVKVCVSGIFLSIVFLTGLVCIVFVVVNEVFDNLFINVLFIRVFVIYLFCVILFLVVVEFEMVVLRLVLVERVWLEIVVVDLIGKIVLGGVVFCILLGCCEFNVWLCCVGKILLLVLMSVWFVFCKCFNNLFFLFIVCVVLCCNLLFIGWLLMDFVFVIYLVSEAGMGVFVFCLFCLIGVILVEIVLFFFNDGVFWVDFMILIGKFFLLVVFILLVLNKVLFIFVIKVVLLLVFRIVFVFIGVLVLFLVWVILVVGVFEVVLLLKIRVCNCVKKLLEDFVVVVFVLIVLFFVVGVILFGLIGGVRFIFIFVICIVELKFEYDLCRLIY